MCVSPLSQDYLDNLKKFQYKSTDASLLYNKCQSPCLNRLVNYLPMSLAPNLITVFSLCCNVIAFGLTVYDVGNDFSKKMQWYTCLTLGLTQFFYQVLDNLDGKQARRTGSSTPFGMLLDHGCDVFTNCFTAYNLSHLYLVGNDTFFSFSVFLGLLFGFYAGTYEELILGEMHFWYINGTDEGNLFICVLGITCSIIGQDFLLIKLGPISIGEIGCCLVLCGCLSCIINAFKNIWKAKGFKQCLIIFIDWLFFYNVIIFPLLNIYLSTYFYQTYTWLILLISSLLFARITIDLQIKVATMDKLRLSFIIVFVNALLILSFFIEGSKHKFLFLCGTALMQGTELIMFIIFRMMEISDYLGIKIFTITPVTNSL